MSAAIRNMFLGIVIGSTALFSGCSPEVGSEAWCSDLKEKSKADWTANEAADFAVNCVLK